MPTNDQVKGGGGVVVTYQAHSDAHATQHERLTQLGFVHRLAALKGYEPGGAWDPARRYDGPVYFVPNDTLTAEQAAALGIRGPEDLFGGVVPHRFIATKAISHGLLAPGAAAIEGWQPALFERIADSVLAGYTCFTPADARAAGMQLLAQGPVRLKPVRASGGRGQTVARDAATLQAQLDAIDAAEICQHGLVLEEDLEDVRTFSVGQVQVGGLLASYHGEQRLTRNIQGLVVYGGSDLTVVRGGFDALLALPMPAAMRQAIEQARRFDQAVRGSFAGILLTRSNYDVLIGRDARGRQRSAVLEQSWRVGGATGPELAAMSVFHADPGRTLVRASGFEVFGDSPEPPEGATVHYRGDDPQVGRLTKYTVIQPDVDPREHH